MPILKIFAKEARVSGYEYQLGLDREPHEEFRSPRVLFGDPRLCAELERTCPHDDSSTNFALSWTEKVDDSLLLSVTRKYVEECLLAGVPHTFYAYTIIVHDESVREATDNRKRSAVHVKIINRLLPDDQHLQPYFARFDRFRTQLFLAHVCIENGWSSPLDPGRERAVNPHHKHGDVPVARRMIHDLVLSVSRLPDGRPDPAAILRVLDDQEIDKIEITVGQRGNKGIAFWFEDHPRPLCFFGELYQSVHDYLSPTKGPENENKGLHKKRPNEDFFPNGYLLRDPETARKIACGYSERVAAHARFNEAQYHINGPKIILGGIAVGVDAACPVSGSGLRRVDPGPKPAAGKTIGHVPGLAELESASRQPPDSAAKLISSAPSTDPTHTSNEPRKERQPTRRETDPDLCGELAQIGVTAAKIVFLVSRIFRDILGALQELARTFGDILEGGKQCTREIVEADSRLGAQGRYLDCVIEEFTKNARRVKASEIDDDDVDPYFGECVSRGTSLISSAEKRQKPTTTTPTEVGPEPEIEM